MQRREERERTEGIEGREGREMMRNVEPSFMLQADFCTSETMTL